MTRKQFDKVLAGYVAKERECIAEHEQIRGILLPLVGKPINHKTLNVKVLGGFSLKILAGMYYITGAKGDHLIGYTNSGESTIAVEQTEYSRGFDYFDACHGAAARKRIEQIEAIDKNNAYKIFAKIDKHFNALRGLFGDIERMHLGSFNFAPYYDLLRCIDGNDGSRGSVKLSDFYFIRK